jgi:hypothetical protein
MKVATSICTCLLATADVRFTAIRLAVAWLYPWAWSPVHSRA